MAERTTVTVPEFVGQAVDIATETAAAAGLVLSSMEPDGPGIRSRTVLPAYAGMIRTEGT